MNDDNEILNELSKQIKSQSEQLEKMRELLEQIKNSEAVTLSETDTSHECESMGHATFRIEVDEEAFDFDIGPGFENFLDFVMEKFMEFDGENLCIGTEGNSVRVYLLYIN